MMRLQAVHNPAFADFVSIEDRFNAYRDWLEKDGVKDPDDFSTNPQELMKGQLEQMKMQLIQMQKQAQMMQQGIQEGQKEQASIQKKSKEAVNKAEGKLKAIEDTVKTEGVNNAPQKQTHPS